MQLRCKSVLLKRLAILVGACASQCMTMVACRRRNVVAVAATGDDAWIHVCVYHDYSCPLRWWAVEKTNVSPFRDVSCARVGANGRRVWSDGRTPSTPCSCPCRTLGADGDAACRVGDRCESIADTRNSLRNSHATDRAYPAQGCRCREHQRIRLCYYCCRVGVFLRVDYLGICYYCCYLWVCSWRLALVVGGVVVVVLHVAEMHCRFGANLNWSCRWWRWLWYWLNERMRGNILKFVVV